MTYPPAALRLCHQCRRMFRPSRACVYEKACGKRAGPWLCSRACWLETATSMIPYSKRPAQLRHALRYRIRQHERGLTKHGTPYRRPGARERAEALLAKQWEALCGS